MGRLERAQSRAKRNFVDDPSNRRTSDDRPPFWVRNYDALWKVLSLGKTEAVHGATLDLADFEPGQSLLDVGCGTGDLVLVAEARAKRKGIFTGLDPEPHMIAQANAKAEQRSSAVSFVQGSIDAIPEADNTFDVVTSSLMLHHLPEEMHAPAIAEVFRVLKSGGRFVVVDFNPAKGGLINRMHGTGGIDPIATGLPPKLEAAGFVVKRTGQHPKKKGFSFAVSQKP
jgi:demethylmenaquinone methyltransferase/2-methoxy-6-polyprenyl-1,4-benzoquinol methylase/phosphoethanolamine N-methyltransferase